MHPPHVPLVREPEATLGHGAGHVRPRRRLLGEGRGVGVLLADGGVELTDEVDRLDVLAAAEGVGDPLVGLARVVEVEHRRHGVDPQPVDVVALEPRDRARHQERAHLGPPVVEDRRRPVRVKALSRVGVLVEVGAVELGEGVGVHREVRRDPVEDHADAPLVEVVDERHQVGRRAVARGRGEVAGGLVAPRPVERVLHHRQQLDVGEAVGEGVLGERRGELAIARPALARCDETPPRPEVHLVDRHRRVGGDALRPARSSRPRLPSRRRGRR